MKTRKLLRTVRTLAAASFAGTVLVVTAAPASHAAPAQSATPVTLQGAGAWSVSQLVTPWANDLLSAPKPIDMQYTQHGSQAGRQDLVAGTVDYAITGVPLQPGDVAAGKTAPALIDAPIQVAALATVVEPFNTFYTNRGGFATVEQLPGSDADHPFCDPQDPESWPPGVTDGDHQCFDRELYHGDNVGGQEMVRIPSTNLAAMYFHYLGGTRLGLSAWNDPGLLAAFGIAPPKVFDIGAGGYRPDAAPGVAGRSDPDETTYFLQLFAKQAANDVWEGVKQSRPGSWEPITEAIPRSIPGSVTRDGAEQQLDQLVNGGEGVGVNDRGIAGGLADVPPSMLKPFKVAFPKQPVMFAEMQNKNGDWVGPTPDAINAAVDAGLDSPLYALTNSVPGAYPLVWVDHLYAPAHGLSQPKTEAMATMIRYLVTTGQTKEAAAGEGRLPKALVDKALESADKIVRSNCTGNGMKVVQSSDPGPMAPASATEMKQIGTMLHCESSAPTTPTTTFTGSGGSDVGFDNSSFDTGLSSGSQSSGDGTSATDVSGDATSPAAGGTNATGRPAAKLNAALITAENLPIPPPTGTTGADRLATFLIGVFLYLLLRKPVTRLAKRIAL